MGDRNYLGQGLKYPFEVTNGKITLVSGNTKVKQSIYDILSTPLGSLFFNRSYGSRLFESLFEQNDSILATLLENDIVDALEKWEKRIEVGEITFDFESNIVNITINYKIKANGTFDSLIYPYYRKQIVA